MDYLSLNDDKFIKEILKLYSNNSLEVLEFLRNNEGIVLRIKRFVDEHIVKCGNITKFRNFYKSYESYLYTIKFIDIINNSESYSTNDKIDFILSEKKDFSFKYFSSSIVKKIEFILSNKDFIQNGCNSVINFDYVNYDYVLNSVKKIIDYYKKYDDVTFFSYVLSFFSIGECEDFCEIVFTLYFQNLFLGNNILNVDIFNDLSFDDIYLVNNINWHVYNINFCEFSNVSDIDCEKSDFDDLFVFLDDMNNFFKSGKELDYFIFHMVKDLNISLNTFESRYLPLFKRYINLKRINQYNITRGYDFVDIYKFVCILDVYRALTRRSSRMIDIILNNDETDDFYNMVYEIKYYNDIVPFSNKMAFLDRNRELRTNEKILKFIDCYEIFYNERKQEEKLVEQEKAKQEKNDKVDVYVSYIRSFIAGGYDKLDSFFYNTSVDKNDFYEGLEFLKEINHPIVEEYTTYINRLQKRRFLLLLKNAKGIVNGIKNGIKLSDGSIRKFDLIDYYSYTHMDVNDFLKFVKENVSREPNDGKAFSISDFKKVANSLGKFKDIKPVTEKGLQILLDSKYAYQLDSDNNYEVTTDDKNNVLLILKERGIPITTTSFAIMLRRYVFENYFNGKVKK